KDPDSRKIISDGFNDYAPDFSPESTELLYRSDKDGGGLYRVSLMSNQPIPVAHGGRDGKFSPDGHQIAFWKGDVGGAMKTGTGKIFLVGAKGGQAQEFLKGFDVAAYPIWSANGQQILFLGRQAGDSDGDWWVADVAQRTAHRTGMLKIEAL